MAQIETWKPQYTKYFEALNRGWIVRFFDENTIEPFEVELLTNPKKEILDKGGHLFFATESGNVLLRITGQSVHPADGPPQPGPGGILKRPDGFYIGRDVPHCGYSAAAERSCQ